MEQTIGKVQNHEQKASETTYLTWH